MTTHHNIWIASPASSKALSFLINMDKLALALLLVTASVVSEVQGSSLVTSERALSRVKRLDDTFEPEPNAKAHERLIKSKEDSADNDVLSSNDIADPIKSTAVANPKHSHRRNPDHEVTKQSNDIRTDGKSTKRGVKIRNDLSSPEDELQEIRKAGARASKRRSGPVLSTRGQLVNNNSIQKPREHWWHRQRRLWQKRNSEYMNKNGQPMPIKRRWRELRKDDRENRKHRIQNRQPETIENAGVNFSPQTQKKSNRPTNEQRHLVTRKKSHRNGVPEDEELTLRDVARNFHHSKRLETKRLPDDQEINEMDSTQDLVSHVKKIRKHSANKRPKSN